MKNYFTHKFRNKSPLEIVGAIIFGTILITGLAILLGFIIMWLWNGLMPELFGLTTITYWQGVGLFILLKILLGGCGGGGKSSKKSKKECKTSSKKDFSKWRHYDTFWKEEGDTMFNEYIERKNKPTETNEPE
ncbi:MAG: hypothetical protein KUG68_08420 [Flavobacteriaceae bacterium]|nr:hypothetical protein [Flavobacteriaceae bacterium]